MLSWIDRFLNGTTMYRLVLYELFALCAAAFILQAVGWLPGNPLFLLVSIVYIVAVCWLTNWAFSTVYRTPANVESVYISALIFVLIITQPQSLTDMEFFTLAGWASVLGMASKYVIAWRRKHIFNPVALGVAVTALAANQSASWWVGSAPMLPFIVIGGFLIVRKIQRFDLVLSFLGCYLLAIAVYHYVSDPTSVIDAELQALRTYALFLATVMLTEPLTTPPRRWHRMLYGALTGLIAPPFVHIGALSSTPELALLAGNLLSYALTPKARLLLTLKEKVQLTPDTVDFIFAPDRPMRFTPGQYLEWTLPHTQSDSRGNRRTFTIASAPEEKDIHLGVKFYEPSSTFKRTLRSLERGAEIAAGQLAGDFVMPRDPSAKLVFVAGGIGITPFRSMVESMVDSGQKRDVVLLYSNRTIADIAYREFFDAAAAKIGMKNVYTVTDMTSVPPDWKGQSGRIDAAMIQKEIPDFADRTFYVSGTHAMVQAFEKTLHGLGIPRRRIVKDFFPGFA